MIRPSLLAVPLFLWLGACSSAPPAAGKGEGPRDEASNKKAQMERDFSLATKRLEKARLELKNLEETNKDAIARAEAEASIATAAVKNFTETESKIRVERAQLRLQMSKDNLDEAKEELGQLELMYKEQDLADKTREIVLLRGKRRVERAEVGLSIDKRDIEQLTTQALPLEEQKLRLDMEGKVKGLAQTRRQAEEGVLEKRIAVMSAEFDVAKLAGEMEKPPGAKSSAQ